jgi:basic membrane lipoprotein Med (substrate-binding protein (PBP1-ABC) superfamily)
MLGVVDDALHCSEDGGIGERRWKNEQKEGEDEAACKLG